MDLGLKDRIAFVTGAGGGLGRAIAETLAQEGAVVAACDISEEALRYSNKHGTEIHPYVFDLSDKDAGRDIVGQVNADLGDIEVLINITGGPPPTPATDTSVEDWEKHFKSMISPVIHLSNLVLPKMRERKWGRIITSTSSGVVTPIPNLAISNGLRSGLLGWSKTLANEVGKDGVTVNIVLPGRVATQRIKQLDEAKAQREKRSIESVALESTSSIAVGRYGDPTEYAAPVAFVASERASYITGSVIRIDGGLIKSI